MSVNTLRNILPVAAACIILTAASACLRDTDSHSEWQTLPAEGWAYGDTIVFNADSADTLHARDIIISLRHTDAYPYANIWLEIAYRSGDTTIADSVDITIADQFGRWTGSGNGASMQLTDTIQTRFAVSPGSPLRIRHILRVDTLRELDQIGVAFR